MNKENKIYIAGHRGMVGSAILRELQDEGYEHLITRTSSELDLRNQADVNDFFQKERPDYVFLAAAKVGGIMANNIYRADFLYDNMAIQFNVINAAHNTGVKRLQFLGSSCIYPKMADQPLKEEYLLTGPLEPTNEPYAIAKIAGIKLCDSYRDQYGDDFHAVMPTNLYGPNDNYDLNSSHVLPAFVRKFHLARLLEEGNINAIVKNLNLDNKSDWEGVLAKAGIESDRENVVVNLWGSGTPKREFLHVDDLARACVFVMKSGFKGSFLNIGMGEDIAIKDLAEKVKQAIGFKGLVCWDQSKPDGTPRKLMNIDKVLSLGWSPHISLDIGIKSIVEDYTAE